MRGFLVGLAIFLVWMADGSELRYEGLILVYCVGLCCLRNVSRMYWMTAYFSSGLYWVWATIIPYPFSSVLNILYGSLPFLNVPLWKRIAVGRLPSFLRSPWHVMQSEL